MGERIVIARASQGLTQADLAERLGKSYQQVSQWERDEGVPRAKNLGALAEALGIEMEWLRTGAGPMLPPLKSLDLQACAREPGGEPYTAPSLDIALLQQALHAAFKVAPKETPERLAEVIAQAYDTALRTRRLDKVGELVRMLLS